MENDSPKIGGKKDTNLPIILCSKGYKKLVKRKSNELCTPYSRMVRYALNEVYGIPIE